MKTNDNPPNYPTHGLIWFPLALFAFGQTSSSDCFLETSNLLLSVCWGKIGHFGYSGALWAWSRHQILPWSPISIGCRQWTWWISWYHKKGIRYMFTVNSDKIEQGYPPNYIELGKTMRASRAGPSQQFSSFQLLLGHRLSTKSTNTSLCCSRSMLGESATRAI